ncbi:MULTISPECIES: hypothetical protein [Streptococcus]|uniref:hypothetical protein n=1 Tax=Streptococcus TaxID=1301 RepID=UPI0010723211|nr:MULTISPECIES: hypothetical protein [Streptococcus]MBF0776748.1 hypothetical protein [Streptococcus sp. 19428wD3_AN2]
MKQMEASSSNFWLIREMKDGNKEVLNIFANDWLKISFPLKIGRLLSTNDVSTALVGQSVETILEEGREYVICFNQRYEVIGRIGMLDNSPLSNTVIISDKRFLFSDGEVSLNGDFEDSKLVDLGEVGDNRGIERLLSLSKFALLIQIGTLVLVSLSTIIWIHFFIQKKCICYRIYYLLGKDYQSIYRKELCKLFLINSSIMALSFGLFVAIKERMDILFQFLLLMVFELICFTYFFYRGLDNADK